MPIEREVAGLRCSEVLARLSAYVDGELAEVERAQVEAHVAGCTWCEHFGGEFAGMVGQVRRTMTAARAPAGLLERVLAGR